MSLGSNELTGVELPPWGGSWGGQLGFFSVKSFTQSNITTPPLEAVIVDDNLPIKSFIFFRFPEGKKVVRH